MQIFYREHRHKFGKTYAAYKDFLDYQMFYVKAQFLLRLSCGKNEIWNFFNYQKYLQTLHYMPRSIYDRSQDLNYTKNNRRESS